MSNPAVITLSSVDLINNINFRIEDNIGECIHIHYANYRFDFSIKDFLELENLITESISNSIELQGFNLDDFDIIFLASIADKLINLKKSSIELIPLNKLKVSILKHGIPKIAYLKQSMMVKSLSNDVKAYENYNQENRFEESNMERLKRVKDFIDSTGVDKIKPIILFNDQDIIRDGQHRSAIFLKNKIKEIKALRLHFEDNKFNESTTPLFDTIFKWKIARLKNKYRDIRALYRGLKKRVLYKIYITFKKS